jgi:hypothetical protein
MDANNTSKLKMVYTITERGERSFWTRIGIASVNRDGSLNVRLDAIPVNGTLHVRDWTPREEQPANGDGRAPRGNGSARPADPLAGDGLPEAFS